MIAMQGQMATAVYRSLIHSIHLSSARQKVDLCNHFHIHVTYVTNKTGFFSQNFPHEVFPGLYTLTVLPQSADQLMAPQKHSSPYEEDYS